MVSRQRGESGSEVGIVGAPSHCPACCKRLRFMQTYCAGWGPFEHHTIYVLDKPPVIPMPPRYARYPNCHPANA